MNAQNINRLFRATHSEQPVKTAERRPREAARTSAKDQVVISSAAQDLLKLREVITNAPDVRAERVRALQEAIARGTYHVPAADIAAKMLGISEDGKS